MIQVSFSLLKNNLNQSDFELVGKGISGNKISDLLVRYETDVLDLNPDLVFYIYRINDVWHKYDFWNWIRYRYL